MIWEMRGWGFFFSFGGFLMIIFSGFCARANPPAYVYDYNARLRQACEAILRLELDEGSRLLDLEARENPHNLMVPYIADYRDGLELFLLGDPALLRSREPGMDQRISRLSLGPGDNPWYRLTRAGVHFRWALVYLRFGEHWKAAVQLRRSYQFLRAHRREFPGSPQGILFEGIEQVFVSVLPSSYKWLERILGIKGDGKEGLRKVRWFVHQGRPGDPFHAEALLFLAYFQGYVDSDMSGLDAILKRKWFQQEEQRLAQLIRADILLNFGRAEESRKVLEPLVFSGEVDAFPLFDFLLAKAYLHALDTRARHYLQQFVKKNHGVFYEKEAMRLLSLLAYLDGDEDKARYWKSRVRESSSPSLIDADRRAERFSSQTEWPHPDLLRVQWLTDGGFISRGKAVLEGMDPRSLDRPEHELEYYYRLGKLLEEEGRWEASLNAYARAMELGQGSKEQYGARAALQSGRIWERQGKPLLARQFYERCLSMKNHDFQNAIDQQAKAGLERLK